MSISRNPTRTLRIERAWLRDINRRWAQFKLSALAELRRLNTEAQPLANASTPFQLSPSQQRVYLAFIESEIQRLLTVTDQAPNWQAVYQAQSYERGLEITRAALLAQGSGIAPTAAEQLAAQGLQAFSAVPTLSTGRIGAAGAIHQDALQFLFERSYADLKGWTDKLERETRNILFAAVEQGHGVDKVVRDLSARIDVSRSRARVIAQTETNQAYSRSAINSADQASDEIGLEVKMRWLTRRDELVRPHHASLHGRVMTTEEASAVKLTDGINCRCGLAPVVPSTDTAKKRERFAEERKQLVALSS